MFPLQNGNIWHRWSTWHRRRSKYGSRTIATSVNVPWKTKWSKTAISKMVPLQHLLDELPFLCLWRTVNLVREHPVTPPTTRIMNIPRDPAPWIPLVHLHHTEVMATQTGLVLWTALPIMHPHSHIVPMVVWLRRSYTAALDIHLVDYPAGWPVLMAWDPRLLSNMSRILDLCRTDT